jgi:hypothetical protein
VVIAVLLVVVVAVLLVVVVAVLLVVVGPVITGPTTTNSTAITTLRR